MNDVTKAIIDNIFEELFALQESIDGGAVNIPAKTAADKVEMLTIKECTDVIQGLSEHNRRGQERKNPCQQGRPDRLF